MQWLSFNRVTLETSSEMGFSLVILELLPLRSVCVYGYVCTCVYSIFSECTLTVFILSLAASLLWSAITILEVVFRSALLRSPLSVQAAIGIQKAQFVNTSLQLPRLDWAAECRWEPDSPKQPVFLWKEEFVGQQAAETWEDPSGRQVIARVPTLRGPLEASPAGQNQYKRSSGFASEPRERRRWKGVVEVVCASG